MALRRVVSHDLAGTDFVSRPHRRRDSVGCFLLGLHSPARQRPLGPFGPRAPFGLGLSVLLQRQALLVLQQLLVLLRWGNVPLWHVCGR